MKIIDSCNSNLYFAARQSKKQILHLDLLPCASVEMFFAVHWSTHDVHEHCSYRDRIKFSCFVISRISQLETSLMRFGSVGCCWPGKRYIAIISEWWRGAESGASELSAHMALFCVTRLPTRSKHTCLPRWHHRCSQQMTSSLSLTMITALPT